ncbi:Hint domain-containing protein [Methylorubrum sp. SB2]|uniref:Hint domain-containing protein n=1 Tax=Methylorubrum subtropicum TaxID=3138812 RepID=UPI00313ADB89
MPTSEELRAFDNIYPVTFDANQNAIISGPSPNTNATTDFQDLSDGSNDDPNLLGDIPNDRFYDDDNAATLYYYRRTTDNSDVIVSASSNGQGPYYLYTNNFYSLNTSRPTTASPYNLVCYAAGSSIRTRRGEVAVEHLRVGDLAVTVSGAARPIRWIGHRTVRCQGRTDWQPVRIAAHAFSEGRPARDLFVSPAHAIAVDVLGEILIPAIRLVNGTTVSQVAAESVTYWHVELDSHDLLIVEGLAAESYLDCGNRRFFADTDATDLLAAPDARPEGPLPFCRPFHEAGPLVDLVRARLAERAEALGWRRVEDTFAGLHLVADGRVVHPEVFDLTARFVLPAGVRDLRLVSAVSVPTHVIPGSTDDRPLGLPLAALTIDDGLTGARVVALDDPRLREGFHAAEAGTRWTRGEAVLPPELWAGCRGTLFLRLMLTAPALPRWVAPVEAIDWAELGRTA